MGEGAPLVEVRDLSRSYRTGPHAVHALRGVSFTIARGEIVALVGPSGSGKSTCLHLLAGLDRPTGGAIRVAGHDLAALDRDGLARYRRDVIGMVFQQFHLLPTLSARRNVELALAIGEVPRRERAARTSALLESVGLTARAEHRPTELSGGEQQRVALARALARDPALLLADEPTGNLDAAAAGQVVELLQRPVREGRAALVLVTHNLELARRVAHRVLEMRDGALVAPEAAA